MAILFVPAGQIDSIDQLSVKDTLLRCEAALNLWFEQHFSHLLVTGGVFNPSRVQTEPAAVLMAEWFVSQGVPRDRILIEDQSLDTFENVRLSYDLLRDSGLPDWQDLVVVTHWTHLARFRILFHKWYGISIRGLPLRYPLTLAAILREIGSFLLCHLSNGGNGFVSRLLRAHRRQA